MQEKIKRRKDEGFTLIELMIVIAVIGILAVVLVPKVGSIKTQAKSAGVDTNVRVVEGFVQSRINYWANSNTAQYTDATHGIQSEIAAAFNTVGNQITNPISNSTAVVASTSGITAPLGTVNDALQVGGVVSIVLPKGGVSVVSTGLGSALTISLTGYDANGSITSTTTIIP